MTRDDLVGACALGVGLVLQVWGDLARVIGRALCLGWR